MRILLYIATFFLLALHAQAQNTFRMVFSSTGYDKGVDAFRTSDQGYLIVGNTVDYGQGGKDIWIIALDSNAQFLWQKTYGSSANEEAVDAILMPNDDLWICGNATKTNPPSVNTYLLHIDKNGVPLMEKRFGGADWDFAESIFPINDSILGICGYSYNGPHSGYINPMVLTISSINGDSLWTSYAGSTNEEINTDLCAKNGMLFLTGYTVNSQGKADSAFAKAIDSSGQLQWHSILPTWDGALLSLSVFEDTLLASTGYRYDSTKQWREPIIASINQKGNWYIIRDEAHGKDSYFSDLIIDSFNYITVAGMSTQHTNGQEDLYFGAFDRWGWYHKANILGGAKDDTPSSIIYHEKDSSYLVCGTTESFGIPYSAIILAQTETSTMHYDTTLIYQLVSGIKKSSEPVIKIKTYPNPASEQLYIQWENPKNTGNWTAELINQNGQVVLRNTFNSSKAILHLINLSSGNYYLRIESKFGRNISKLIIE